MVLSKTSKGRKTNETLVKTIILRPINKMINKKRTNLLLRKNRLNLSGHTLSCSMYASLSYCIQTYLSSYIYTKEKSPIFIRFSKTSVKKNKRFMKSCMCYIYVSYHYNHLIPSSFHSPPTCFIFNIVLKNALIDIHMQ